jgi:hypothetical protein
MHFSQGFGGSTDEANYYVYYCPVWHDGVFMLQCCSRGCGARVSWLAKRGDAVITVFSNPMRHLKTCPGNPLLTHQDWLDSRLSVRRGGRRRGSFT